MKKLLSMAGVGLLTSAMLDPLINAMLELPVAWFRDILMAAAGSGCLYLLIKYRNNL